MVGDNARALRWLRARYAGQVQCAYLDPPFNTQSRAFAYRDARPRADWLCFMDERLALSRELLREDGTLYASTYVWCEEMDSWKELKQAPITL